MKKLLLCLAVILGFGLTAAAQNSGAVTALTASDPANGGFVSELPDAVTLTFGNATRVTESDAIETYDDFFTSMSLAGKSLNPGSVVGNYRISGNTVVFQTSLRNQSVSDGDVFTFTLAPGALKADGQDISLTYSVTVGADPAALKFTASRPENGGTTPSFPESFSLTFGNATSIALANPNESNIVAYSDGVQAEANGILNQSVSGNTVTFTFGRDANMYLTGTSLSFHFPDGELLADGKAVPAFDYGFTIKADDPQPGDENVTFTPKNGSILESISKVIIDTKPQITSIDTGYAVMTRTYNGVTTEIEKNDGMFANFITEDGFNGMMEFTFKKQTAPGEYTITFEKGFFCTGSSGTGNSPEYVVKYTIPEGIVTMESVLNSIYPNDTDMLPAEYWEGGTVTVALDIKGTVAQNSAVGKITMNFNGKDYEASVQTQDDEGSTSVYMMFAGIPTENEAVIPGTYTLNVPGGYFTVDGKVVGPYTKSWTIVPAPVEYAYDWDPKVGKVDLTQTGGVISSAGALITLQFAWMNLELAGKSDLKAKLVYDETQEVVAEFSSNDADQQIQLQQGKYKFNIRNAVLDKNKFGKGINVNGKYTLTLPEGFFVSATGVPNKEASFTWELTGGIDPNLQQVYTYSPEAGAYDVFPTVTLTYENCTKIVLSPSAVGQVYLTNNQIGVCKVTTDGINKVTFTPTRDIRDQAPSEFSYYALKADAGIFTLTINGTDVENTAIDIAKVYTIKEPTPAPLVLDPADGAQVTSEQLQVINITTTETVTTNPMKYARLYPVVDGVRSAEPIASYRISVPSGTNSGTFTVTAADGVEIPEGVYDFVIPAEQYRVTLEGRARQSKEQVARYYVGVEAPKVYTFVTDPADGATVNAPLTDIFVTPEGASSIEVLLPLKLTKGQVSYDIVGVVAENKANYMIVTQEITAGEWTALVPANGLKIDGEVYAKEISWKFTVADGSAAEMPKPAANPAEGQVSPEQLDEIILTPADGAKATKLGEDDTYLITLSPVTDGVAGISVRTYTASINEEGQVVLKVQGTDLPALEKGDYRLNVMANSFFIGEQGNPVFDYDYKVLPNSVDTVYGNDTEFNVYTATGIVVVRNGNADDVNALAPGLYIINGKKVLIRK
ncbi:MAG: hypothetical protein J6C81_08430 [Muribaculaceae bacterium]|nr:hypothetical protein [Muribaculaceae bacterium]